MISHPSASGRQQTVEFQALPSRTGQIRRIVSAQLRYWKLEALVGPAADGVTELLAGALRQAGPNGRCTVEIALLLDRLTISVRDHAPQLSPAHVMGALLGSERSPARSDGDGRAARITLPVPAPAAPASPTDGPAGTAGGTAGTAGPGGGPSTGPSGPARSAPAGPGQPRVTAMGSSRTGCQASSAAPTRPL